MFGTARSWESLADLFAPDDFRWRMGVRRVEPADFLVAGPDADRILDERRDWLQTDPVRYAAALGGAEDMIEETGRLIREWGGANVASSNLAAIGMNWEPDLLLLRADENGEPRLQAGCVCFPSWWDLKEKLGLTLAEIHAPAPRLEAAVGRPIGAFLARLKPGEGWTRSNWGLAATPERNLHPALNRPRIGANPCLEETWLRLEDQFFARLPETGGWLFAIRISSWRTDELRDRLPDAARALSAELRSMPEEIAFYKGLSAGRAKLVGELEK
jgi:dimethylamine monooxygenase subunit A